MSRHRKAAMDFASAFALRATADKSLYPSYELSEEATVAVFSNDIEEFFNRSRFQVRLVTVPLSIISWPKDLPHFLTLVMGGFRNWMFEHPAFVEPMGPDLIYFDALTGDTECKVDLGAEMCWRSPLLDELGKQLLATLRFKL